MSDINETANPFLKPYQPDPGIPSVSPFLPIQEPAYGQSFNPNSLAEPEEVARQRYLAAMIETAPDKDYEAGRQRMAATVHALYPELSFDQVYQNPFPVVAQLTGYDFRNGGQPEDVLSILKEKMQGVADNFQRNMVAMDVGDLSWEQRNAGTDTEKLKLQTQIDAQKERLKYWPFDRWGAPGTQGGIIDQVLGVGDSSLKFSTDFVAGIVHDVGKPVVTAFNAQDIQHMGDLAKVTTSPKGGTDDPLSILTSPHTEVGPDGKPVTVQGRPLQAFLLWGIKNTPLVGTGYARMAGSSYSEMIDAGVDPGTANVLSDTVAKAGAAANLVSFGLLGNVVSKGVSRLVAGDVLDNAVFTGVKKYLMSGQNLNELAKSGMVKLETTQGGRLIKAVGQTAANSAEMGLVNGGLVAVQDIAFNASVELTNGLIKAKGESESHSRGITDEYEINKYVNDNAPRLAAPFKDVIGDFTKTFIDTLGGMVALGGAAEFVGGRLVVKKPVSENATSPEVTKTEVPVFNPATDKIDVAQTKATVHVGDTTTEIPITRENGAIHVTGDVAPEIAPHLAQKLADAGEGQRIEAESPALRAAVENLNPDAPVIRERISGLETQVANLESDNAPAERIEPLRVQLQSARDELVTPTEAWKAPRPETMTPAEFSAHQESVMASRAGLGDTIPEHILKAAPNVTEPQAKSIGDLVARMELNTGQKLVDRIVHDDGIDANGAANQADRVIKLSRDANFDTVFHEVAHLARTLLTEDQHRTLVDELKLDTEADGFTLTRAGEESFAEHARTYVQNKENASPLLETIKKFIRDIVQAIAPRLSDKAIKTFDSLFGEGDTFTHDRGNLDQSGKVGDAGRVAGGKTLEPGQGLDATGRPEAGPVLDSEGRPIDPALADQAASHPFPGELQQKKGISEHERLIQKALADGKYVPDHVIEAYLEKPWALEEWNKRHPESQRALEATALTSESADDFVARVTDPLYPEDNIPESIKGLSGEDLKTELADYWERTNKKDSAVEFKQTLKNFTPEEITSAYRDALVQGSRREGALKTQLSQARKRSEFNSRMETEARVKIKGLEESLTSARAEAKATASKTYQTKIKSLENALTDARAEHELTLRHLADARRERATMEKLAKSIMRPVGTKTIDVHSQGFLKAIQNSIDPRFRRESTLARRTDAKRNFDTYLKMIEEDGFLGTGFKSKEALERTVNMAEKKSLDQFTLQDLADVADVFNQAYQHGKKVLEDRVANRKAEEAAMINDILTRAEKAVKHRLGTGIVTMQNIEKVQGTILDVAARYSLDPHRFFDLLDGGHATWNGPFYNSFIRTLDKAEDARIEGNRAFQSEFESVLSKNGFKNALGHPDAHEFFTKIDVDGRSLYVQEAMDVYLKWMNDKSRAALVGDGERTGNRYTQEFHDKVVETLTPGQKAVADWILEYYNRPETKDAYFSFVEENQNYTPVDEPNYTRIRHLGFFKERSDTNIRLEMAGRSMGPMAVLPSGAAINRVEISEHHQTPLQLGIIDEVFESVDFNNRYMNFLEPIRKLEAVYADRSVQELVQDKMGNEGMARIRSYIDLAKNPNMGKNPDTIFRIMRAVKSNISKAYMGFNPKTVAMQIAAPLLYAGELENPAMLLVGISEVNKGWNDTFRKIEQLSPQLWARLNHGTMRQILASTDDTYLRMLGDKSMAGIGHADTLFAAWGWWAVFKEKSEKINIKTGKQNTEAEAAKMADEAMNRTQQPTFMKDKAELFGNNEALSWLTMFQGPLNKVFNQLAYDMPRGPGGFRKAATLFGVLATGYVTWMVASGKPAPTDDKEWAQLVAGQIFGAPVPIIGSTINNMVYGYDKTGHFTPAEPFQEALDAGKVAINAVQGKYSTEEAFQKFIDKAYGFYALANGVPLVEVRRAFQVTKDAMDGKGVQIQNLMGKEYGK